MLSQHDASRLRAPMSAHGRYGDWVKPSLALAIGVTALGFIATLPPSGGATAAAPAAAERAAAPVRAVPTVIPTVGTPCEQNGWPYLDQRCANAAPGEPVRTVRVIRIDQVAPTTIVTPVATLDMEHVRAIHAAELAAAKSRMAAAAAPHGTTRQHGRVKVIAQTVPTNRARTAERPAHTPVMISLHVAPPPPSTNALAYSETPAPAVASFRHRDSQFR